MGGRDFVNPWGKELPPCIVVGKSEHRDLSAIEIAMFSQGEEKMRELEKQFEVDGVFIEPEDDEDDGFIRRMTGL